jgi:nitrate reductase gamma subunit
MDAWIEFARGPLFRASLTVLVLGLGYRIVLAMTNAAGAWRRAGDRALPWRAITVGTLEWVFPIKLLRLRPLLSVASFCFHLGLVVVPLFLLGHVALLPGILPAWWPVLGATVADALTLLAIASCLFIFAARLAPGPTRALTGAADLVLLVVLLLVLVTGLLAAKPTWTPVDARLLLLLHVLFGNAALVLVPTTKIVHCVLFPFTRLSNELGWRNVPGVGDRILVALAKENERV